VYYEKPYISINSPVSSIGHSIHYNFQKLLAAFSIHSFPHPPTTKNKINKPLRFPQTNNLQLERCLHRAMPYSNHHDWHKHLPLISRIIVQSKADHQSKVSLDADKLIKRIWLNAKGSEDASWNPDVTYFDRFDKRHVWKKTNRLKVNALLNRALRKCSS